MIRFRCKRCRKEMEAADEFAGLPVRCGACDTTQTLPLPGLKRQRLQCCICGSEFTLREASECPACGEPDGLRRWCRVHHCVLTTRACPRCIEEYGRRFRPPKPPAAEKTAPPAQPPPPPGEPVAVPVTGAVPGDVHQAMGPLAFGVASLALSLFCTCLASLLGGVAVGWGATVYQRIEAGSVAESERSKTLVAMGLGILAIVIDVIRFIVMLTAT